MNDKQTAKRIARTLKREVVWEIDRDTKEIRYVGPNVGGKGISVNQLYSMICEQMDHEAFMDNMLDITD